MSKDWIFAFGGKLRKLRENQNLLQADVANSLAISPSTYGQYETGKREPSLKVLRKIALYFDSSIDKLIFDEYQQAKMFWIDCGYRVEILNGREVVLHLPLTGQIIYNGKVTSLHGKERKIIFANKKSFVDFTDKTQKKYRADCISQYNDDVITLYHKIEEGDSEIDNVHVQEMRIEKKYSPAK